MDEKKLYDDNSTMTPETSTESAPEITTTESNIDVEDIEYVEGLEAVTSEPEVMSDMTQDIAPEETTVSEPKAPEHQYYWQPSIKAPEPKPKKRFFPKLAAGFMVLALVAGTFFGAGYAASVYLSDSFLGDLLGRPELTADSKVNVNQIQPVLNLDATYEQAPVMIAEEVGPSVVTINTQYESEIYSYFAEYYSEGSGSGVIFDITGNDILMVTNYHVIQNTVALNVRLFDGTVIDNVEILGYDSSLDLAVISIPVESVPDDVLSQLAVVTFGDSDAVKLGEMVIAIGSPLGEEFANTVTAGIISGLDRTLAIDNVSHSYIQTDASINPGNSGGALLNIEGELIGINTAKSIDVDVEGMGFAIPINLAKPIIFEIVSNPTGGDIADDLSTDRPFLGVQIQDVAPGLSEDVQVPFGVYVADVFEGGGAYEAGIQAGDVIIAIDGERILNTAELTSAILAHEVGDVLEITIVRDDEIMDVSAPLYHYDDVINE